jgi:RNA polymerase sigma-70 factor (ECF subfamily)
LLLIAEADSDTESGTPASGGLLWRAVELVRAEFEERSWQAFWRVTVDGQPVGDVARDLGVSANAVYVARSRILRRLREVLSDAPPSTG